jgi:hypothetical protein
MQSDTIDQLIINSRTKSLPNTGDTSQKRRSSAENPAGARLVTSVRRKRRNRIRIPASSSSCRSRTRYDRA